MSANAGMFEPLTDGEGSAAAKADMDSGPSPIVPVPADAPQPNWPSLRPKEATTDAPTETWTYHTGNGGSAFVVARWMGRDGKKIVRPVCWVGTKWALRAMTRPRPLYNLPDMLSASDTPIVVVEGEKCATAAAKVFADHAVTTWAGGASAWRHTNWSPLAGRNVLLLADGNEAGRRAMSDIATHLAAAGGAIRIHLPAGDHGFDIADALDRDGPERTREQIEAEASLWSPEAKISVMPDADGGADWMDELLGRAKTDPGAPFEQHALHRLADLRRSRPDISERLRARFRDETRVRISSLDKALTALANDESGIVRQGLPLEWTEDEPWPEKVIGEELLGNVSALIARYVDIPKTRADAVALWIATTWLHDRLELSTFLNLTSATKRCGKSLLMEVIGALVFRPLPVSGRITPAALFRSIQRAEPTLLLDEADTYMTSDPELRGIVNGSQRQDSAYVLRTVGDDHEPRKFKTWCPKAIAGIGGLPDTVIDRSLTIRLQRRAPNAGELPHWRDRDAHEIDTLRRKFARWVEDNCRAVLQKRNTVNFPSGLHDRARDAWEALFAIAGIAGGEWPERVQCACNAVQANTEVQTGAGEQLLADMWKVFGGAGDPPSMPTGKQGESTCKAIIPALCVMDDRPWFEWRGKPLTPRGLATLLKPFGIAPVTIRLPDGSTLKGYKREALERAWQRYLPEGEGSASVTTPQPASGKGLRDSQSATGAHGVADRATRNPASSNVCGVVADRNLPLIEKNDFNGDFRPFEDIFADADERAAIFEYDAAMSRTDAEWLAERQHGLDPGTLARGEPGS